MTDRSLAGIAVGVGAMVFATVAIATAAMVVYADMYGWHRCCCCCCS